MSKPRGLGKKKVAQKPVAPLFNEDELLGLISTSYKLSDNAANDELKNNNYTKNTPFPHITLNNFFQEEFLEQLKTELLQTQYWEKNNDLYQFLQTKDLQDSVRPNIVKLKTLLYGQHFRSFIEKVTGLEQRNLRLRSDKIDMSGACYRDTNYLLCHDDELEGRRIAYIIYMVPRDWSKEDGGSLDLFNVDDNLQPENITTSLQPVWNSITFFEVSPTSYHQVSQVLRDEELCEDRISLSGWYYCDVPVERPTPHVESNLEMNDPITTTQSVSTLLREWISESYFQEDNLNKIIKLFARNSSINLVDFLRKDKLKQITEELTRQVGIGGFKTVGPANRRHYGKWTESENESNVISQLTHLFRSKEFAEFLGQVTKYDILKQNVKCRRFANNDYTLAHDISKDQVRLDVVLTVLDNKVVSSDPSHGGAIVYMNEDEELLSVLPVDNSLSIVMRDVGVMQFVKFVNHKAPFARFDWCCAYEIPEIEQGDDDDDEEWEDDDDDEIPEGWVEETDE
ncbi:prolyl 3-hydroxylase [Acrasis kona]|uniref:Prolyl 3-hydroxylase n=1 Tax=Acrasis kona TaxID=1008807 RepID=A0AAW2Z8B7_9EUKA